MGILFLHTSNLCSIKITLPKVVYICIVFSTYKVPGYKVFPMSDIRFVTVLDFVDF